MTAAVQRRAMRDRVQIGQAWKRNRGGEIGVIRMIHRADRQVELLGVDGVHLVTFTDLRTKWTEQPSGEPLDQPAAPSTTVAGDATAPFTTEGAAGTTFQPARTCKCRCQLTGDPDCPHCHGTGRRLITRDFEKNSESDLVAYTLINKEHQDVPLPTSKTSREGRDPRDARILIAGPPKVGKTTLAAGWAPDTTLILDTHQGTSLLDGEHYKQHIHDFGDFEAAVNELAAGDHRFRTVVIDLVEDVYKQSDRLAAQRHNQLAAGLVEFGKGTAEAEALFRRAIDKLLNTSLGVWFICHTEAVQDGNIVQFVPRLDKRVRTYVEGACDFVLLADASGTRQLHTKPSARFQAGTRTPLPNPMPLDARNLYVEIAKGLAKPKPAAPSETSAPAQAQEAVAA